MWTRDRRNERGSSLVELALVLPLLLLLLIGTVELGRIAYAAIEVTNAARAAVAFGAQRRGTANDVPDMKTVAAADASNLVSMGATLLTTPTNACYCDTSAGARTSVTCTSDFSLCPAGTTSVVYVLANTTATVPTMFNYPGLPNSFTLNGFAQMRVVQD
jgi:Flp pilus assembly protein TadG